MTRSTALIARIDHAVRVMFGICDAPVRSNPKIAGAGVALQAEHRSRGPDQQLGVRGTMRLMTTDAAVHFACLVFKQKRSALVHMALHAGLIVAVRLVEHLGGLTH